MGDISRQSRASPRRPHADAGTVGLEMMSFVNRFSRPSAPRVLLPPESEATRVLLIDRLLTENFFELEKYETDDMVV